MINISPLSPILEENFALLTPAVVASEPTIKEFSTVLELETDTKPPPAGKYSIKAGDWKVVLDRILKLELDLAAMKAVLYDF